MIASHVLDRLGQAAAAHDLVDAATQAFLHSLSGGCLVAAGVAAVIAVAATARRPRARYVPGIRNRFNTGLLTALPARSGDRIKTRITSGKAAADPAASRVMTPGA